MVASTAKPNPNHRMTLSQSRGSGLLPVAISAINNPNATNWRIGLNTWLKALIGRYTLIHPYLNLKNISLCIETVWR